MIRLKSAGKTDVGLKREENEDNFIMLPDQGLYVLADGMGGHVGGKMASTLAVTLVTEFICVHAKRPNFEWHYPPDESASFEENILANAIKYANERIYIESCKDRQLEGMGTTVTALLATEKEFCLAHVGDSRIYRMRDGELDQLTQDHSLLNHLLSTGEVKPDEIHKFTSTNVILRAVGLKDYVDVSLQRVPKVPGDVYMMCSDGLTDLVDDFVVREVLRTAPSLPDACDQLIKLALHAGGKDNVTVVCVEVEEVQDRQDGRWTTGVFKPIPNQTGGPGQGRPTTGSHTPVPAPQAQITPPPQEVVDERLHAVRVPLNGHARPQLYQSGQNPAVSRQQAPQQSRPVRGERRQRPPSQPQQERVYTPPSNTTPRRGRTGTPPAPMEPISDAEMQEQVPPPGHFGQGARRPSSGQHRAPQQMPPQQSPQQPGAPKQQNSPPRPPGDFNARSDTPKENPQYAPPAGHTPPQQSAQGGQRPQTPPRGQPAPSGQPAPGGQHGAQGTSQQAFPSTTSGQYAPPPGHDSGEYERADTAEEMPAQAGHQPAGQQPAGQQQQAADNHATIKESAVTANEGATVQEMPAFENPMPKAQSGDAELVEKQPAYKEQGKVMVDSSLFDEEEASVVIDESLLMEVGEEDEITHRGPPPTPESPNASRKDRKTEIVPATNRQDS